jgi:glycosidase
MQTTAKQIKHTSSLPYCYFDRYLNKVILRVASSSDVLSIIVIYGDSHEYTKIGEEWQWQYREAPLQKQYSGDDLPLTVWQIRFDIPKRRRLKYGFCFQTSEGEFYFSEKGVVPFGIDLFKDVSNFFSFPYIHEVDAPIVPQWVKDTVWYQIFPERFCNKNPSISPEGLEDWEIGKPAHRNFFGGDIEGVRQKLGYLQELGINGIYLTPIFKSPSNHKYDTTDYFAIDEHFGDIGTLKALVKEAHVLGIKVMLDAVFNHASTLHPFWQDVLKNQEKSAYKDYFHILRFPVKQQQDVKDMDYETFAFVSRMPKWNTENEGARKYLLDAAEYWIRECDIDGWRLDVANEVSFDFWRDFSKRVRLIKDDFYIVGEIWFNASAWINTGLFDSVMHYPLSFAVSDYFLKKSINEGQFFETLFNVMLRYSDLHNQAAFTLLDSHDTDRALTRAAGDRQALKNAFTMLFLLQGSPCIYYGTEIGLEGSFDPDCRRPMIWDEQRQDRELFSFFQRLIRFRRTYNGIINGGSILYKGNGIWKIGDALTVLYTDGAITVNDGNREVFRVR